MIYSRFHSVLVVCRWDVTTLHHFHAAFTPFTYRWAKPHKLILPTVIGRIIIVQVHIRQMKSLTSEQNGYCWLSKQGKVSITVIITKTFLSLNCRLDCLALKSVGHFPGRRLSLATSARRMNHIKLSSRSNIQQSW